MPKVITETPEQAIIRRKKYQKMWRAAHQSSIREYQAKYREEHRIKARLYCIEYQRKRLATDCDFRLAYNLRARIRNAIHNNSKSAATFTLLGCSVEELKTHIESMFKPGMSWDNWGRFGWHIDHIIPCVAFNLADPEQQKQCFHYTNLQPLWAHENQTKSGKIPQ